MANCQVSGSWHGNDCGYAPEIEYGAEIDKAFNGFSESYLSSETKVRVYSVYDKQSELQDEVMDEGLLNSYLPDNKPSKYEMVFINRFLVNKRGGNSAVPQDAAMLRISQPAFQKLVTHFRISPAFIFSLSRYFLPTGKGYKKWCSAKGDDLHEFWCFLPVRMQLKCTDPNNNHLAGAGGNNQMDPFHYLHLPDYKDEKGHKADIRGSQIALYFQYNSRTKSSVLIAINLIDGRWPGAVEEPQMRIKDVLQSVPQLYLMRNPFFTHLIYFTSALRWWTNALSSINLQLIAYENRLQGDFHDGITPDFHESLNKALHAIAAHLHRYASELNSMESTLSEISKYHKAFHDSEHGNENFEKTTNSITQIELQLKPIQHFELELEKKIQNILALEKLFNRIQLSNDRIMVANSTAMQDILRATQEETRMSRAMAIRAHELTEEMKKDSLSMKTIAVLTMFFLPGTSFAALLAMPFFATNPWLGDTSRFWVWVVLTLPSTALAFAFYWYFKRNADRKAKRAKPLDDTIELSVQNGNTTV